MAIHPTAIVSELATLGHGVRLWHWTHVREYALIGNLTSIGQGCYIDAHVTIGADCRIQNGVNLYRGVTLEDRVFVGPGVTFTNDLHPRAAGSQWSPQNADKTLVQVGASLGAGAVILPVTIGEYAMVAAGAVVTRDVLAHQVVRGNPARCVGYTCRCAETTVTTREDARSWRAQSATADCLRCGFSFSECNFLQVAPASEPWRP